MDLIQWIEQQKEWSSLQQLPLEKTLILGAPYDLKVCLLSSLAKKTALFIIVPSEEEVYHLKNSLEDWGAERVYTLTANDNLSLSFSFSDLEQSRANIATLSALSQDQARLVIANATALQRFYYPKKEWREKIVHLEVGSCYSLSSFVQKLKNLGYERQDQVETWGQFSVRGSIIDLFPLNFDQGLRLDFFDEELESLRFFSPATQRSGEELTAVDIIPAQFYFYEEAQQQKAWQMLAQSPKFNAEVFTEEVGRYWQEGQVSELEAYYLPYLRSKWASLMDYVTTDTLLVIDDYSKIRCFVQESEKEVALWQKQQQSLGYITEEKKYTYSFVEIEQKWSKQSLYFSFLEKGVLTQSFAKKITLHCQNLQHLYGKLDQLKADLQMYRQQKWTVVFSALTKEGVHKIAQILEDIDEPYQQSETLEVGAVQLAQTNFTQGFAWQEAKLCVLTERELFASVQRKKRRTQKLSNAERLQNYNELKIGDYVVHESHGIGQYLGIETIEQEGMHRDYLKIHYQNQDQLFIPVDQLNLIQKYVSLQDKAPKLNRLDNKTWHKTKAKVQKQVEDMADELLDLYAQREVEKGYAFPPDDEMQAAFEAAFPYVETEDQLRSTAEIKADMEKIQPMDRLLVGDVGYGKTEVALRAAFKAVRGQKQVAFLVPTTILAEQHYETMLRRFQGFPVRLGLLNRFKSRAEQKEILQQLKAGEIDIIVGTHRLLSQDVHFFDLGLIVIDEEQRFGVKHKERLKQLKTKVDVLTLTATPIPRTLHMSMVGVRDLSVLETPPLNRYPVQTYVLEYNTNFVLEAMEREVARGGQVFYLYNRVATMDEKLADLQALAPNLRFACAHGQMRERELEEVLLCFLAGEYDVLITTTIIETGVDMPNVNTIIVDGAEKMGLSQLYQLKGRVGRSSRLAYAYFMYPAYKVISEDSEQRLNALREFTQLGAGFKIALRDLSIRGAGDLLGSQQHGFINSVGFDLYNEMLQAAIAKKRGLAVVAPQELTMSVQVDAYIPSTYIQAEALKIDIYRRLRLAKNEEEVWEIHDDLLDRFGEYPQAVARLLTCVRLKVQAQALGVQSIQVQKTGLALQFAPTVAYTGAQYMAALPSAQWQLSQKEQVTLSYIGKASIDVGLQEACQLCQQLQEVTHEL